MLRKVILLLMLFAVQWSFSIQAQRARYISLPDSYDLRIPEKAGRTIHIWGASARQLYLHSQQTTLTLYVFSSGMQLTSSQKLDLGKVSSWNIDFQYTDSCYYASIYYDAEARYHILMKIDENGMVTDVSNTPSLWTKTDAYQQRNKNYALELNNEWLYAATIENTDSSYAGMITIPAEAAPAPNQKLQKIIITKTNIETKEKKEQVYCSAYLNFAQPFIHVTDTGVLVYTFVEPSSKNNHSTSYNGDGIFLIRLDTSLQPRSDGTGIIPLNKATGKRQFSPYMVYTLDKKLFIVTTGSTPGEVPPYIPERNISRIFYFQQELILNADISNSLRITVLNSNDQLVQDTIIESRSGDGPLRWDNRFITASDKKIDFFCTRQYRAYKNGITHISINSNGTLTEEEVIVEENYEYHLQGAKKLAEGRLLVPCAKKGRVTGLMVMEYNKPAS